MRLEEINGRGQEGAEAVGLILPEGLALAIELGLEERVVETPAGESDAMHLDGVGDLLIGMAAEGRWMAIFCSAASAIARL
jgi:hypothetical protein